MKNKNNIVKTLIKEESALTIVEVLVAVILTSIVMLHGTLFFMTSWRLSEESKDYSMVLNDVVANLENCVSMAPSSSSSDERLVKERKLRNGQVTVSYRLDKSMIDYNQICFVTSSARWRYDTTATNASDNIINIRTAYYCPMGTNRSTLNSNGLQQTWFQH
jgi:hypothetical protein